MERIRRIQHILAAAQPAASSAADKPGAGFGTMDLSDRVAFVTGGGQGLGGTIAVALARAGADVAIHYNSSADKADATVAEVRALGRQSIAFQADVGDSAQCSELAQKVIAWQGRCDIFVSNAGMGSGSGVVHTSNAEWDRGQCCCTSHWLLLAVRAVLRPGECFLYAE